MTTVQIVYEYGGSLYVSSYNDQLKNRWRVGVGHGAIGRKNSVCRLSSSSNFFHV